MFMSRPDRVQSLAKEGTPDGNRTSGALARRVFTVFLPFACFFLCGVSATGADLQNKTLKLSLGFTANGVPVITQCVWKKTGQAVFTDNLASDSLVDWVPDKFIPDELPPIDWRFSDDYNFSRAEATRDLLNGLRLTWVVELARSSATFRMKVRMENIGDQALGVKWLPTWNADWQMKDKAEWVKWWGALSYAPTQRGLTDRGREEITLGSHLHSSDDLLEGENPYWVVGGKEQRTFFALEWCGGWEARLRADPGTFSFDVRLPPDETQVQLPPGGAIEGPALWVTPTIAPEEALHRHEWMVQRRLLSRTLYRLRQPPFPLNYNSYYATFSEIDGPFLRRQIELMDGYGFDNLVLDFGWFKEAGQWVPNPSRFQPGELEELIAEAQAKGTKVGLWTCPQLTAPSGQPPLAVIDESDTFNRRVGAYLIDLAGSEFTPLLEDHLADLRGRYQMAWWKY